MAGTLKKIYFATYLYIGVTAVSYGQQAYLKAAEEFYSNGDYYSAAQLYEKYLNNKETDKKEFNPYNYQRTNAVAVKPVNGNDVTYKLADSYYKLHQFAKAEPLLQTAAVANSGAVLLYAQTLKFNGKPAEAAAVLTGFINSQPGDAAQLSAAKMELASLEFANAQLKRKDLHRYNLSRKDNWNAPGATYAPALMGDQLVVTSTRAAAGSDAQNPHANKLFIIKNDQLEKLPGFKPDAAMEQGIASFSPAGNRMYFTKWTTEKGHKVAAIYSCVLQGDNWGAPVLMSTIVNAAGATARQPFITSDGRFLLFSSDRSGGKGGNDIWFVSLNEQGEPVGNAVNLEAINTPGNDEAPFYHAASKTLVFSSNGMVGMGGYDLFTVKGILGGTWAAPQNMGYPVNSVKDDLYYISNSHTSVWNNAVLSSDRQSECCLELFAFDKLNVKRSISGSVVDCATGQPVSGAVVEAADEAGKVIFTGTTDAAGQYNFMLNEFAALNAKASASGYEKGAINIAVPAEEDAETFAAAALCIKKIETPVEVNKAIILENVLYAFNKATLSKASYPVFDTLLNLLHTYPDMQIEISAHTDNIGSDVYNQKLSEARAASCVAYLVSKGIAAERLVTKGYGETQPVAPNQINGKDNPAGRNKNRRTAFKILHY